MSFCSAVVAKISGSLPPPLPLVMKVKKGGEWRYDNMWHTPEVPANWLDPLKPDFPPNTSEVFYLNVKCFICSDLGDSSPQTGMWKRQMKAQLVFFFSLSKFTKVSSNRSEKEYHQIKIMRLLKEFSILTWVTFLSYLSPSLLCREDRKEWNISLGPSRVLLSTCLFLN